MKILSIDTSGAMCGAAVVDSTADLLASVEVNLDAVKSAHSVHLMAVVDFVLNKAGCAISDIDAFTVVVGPGSFTGLRVGIATVNGLRYAAGKAAKSAIAVNSLEALAWNFPYSKHPVCSIVDARQGEVYAGVFKWVDDDLEIVVKPGLFALDALLAMRPLNEGRVIFTGSGVTIHKSAIYAALGSTAVFADALHISPYVVGRLGLRKAERGEFSSELKPLYLKMPLAVERLKNAGG